jgi:hypothetical protein
MDDQVEQRLKNNPKVRVEGDLYAYQVRDGSGLLMRSLVSTHLMAPPCRPSTTSRTARSSSRFSTA